MTIRQIRRLVPFWQSILNLHEWHITVRFGKDDDEMQECIGLNFFSVEELESEILLARGEGEETLVHELLHLVFDGHKSDSLKYDAMHERALNRAAKGFMTLKEFNDA